MKVVYDPPKIPIGSYYVQVTGFINDEEIAMRYGLMMNEDGDLSVCWQQQQGKEWIVCQPPDRWLY